MKHFDDLIFWIEERERIRIKKESGEPRPWTTDPILQQYRFCNVFRESDVVTKWIHANWLKPNYDDPMLPFAMAVARMVNLPETLAELGYPREWNTFHFMRVFQERRERRLKSWTSAYMITGGYSVGGETKEVIIARVLDRCRTNLVHNNVVEGDTLEIAAQKIQCPGIGTFLTAQVIADLKWGPTLIEAKDWDTWCAPGPGSTAGLNYLHERPTAKTLTLKQFRDEVNELRSLIWNTTGVALCAQNTQNCLCEFSKYVRTKYYGGSPKSLYTPAEAVPGTTP